MHSYMRYTVKLITFLKLIKPSKTVEVFRFKTEKKSNTVMCIKKKSGSDFLLTYGNIRYQYV